VQVATAAVTCWVAVPQLPLLLLLLLLLLHCRPFILQGYNNTPCSLLLLLLLLLMCQAVPYRCFQYIACTAVGAQLKV
jgi:hypothetical protein